MQDKGISQVLAEQSLQQQDLTLGKWGGWVEARKLQTGQFDGGVKSKVEYCDSMLRQKCKDGTLCSPQILDCITKGPKRCICGSGVSSTSSNNLNAVLQTQAVGKIGAGLYCIKNDLYHCDPNKQCSIRQKCPSGCIPAPSGQSDYCVLTGGTDTSQIVQQHSLIQGQGFTQFEQQNLKQEFPLQGPGNLLQRANLQESDVKSGIENSELVSVSSVRPNQGQFQEVSRSSTSRVKYCDSLATPPQKCAVSLLR